MIATIKTYRTDADVFGDGFNFRIDYDFQSQIFENHTEAEEWADDELSVIKNAANYDDIKTTLLIAIDKYIK